MGALAPLMFLATTSLSAQEALRAVGATVEGANTAAAVLALGTQHHWHLPICHEVVALMEGRISPAAAVRRLMERHLKDEDLPT